MKRGLIAILIGIIIGNFVLGPALPPETESRNSNSQYWESGSFPIPVYVDTDTFSQEERELLLRAIQFWNTVVGSTVFVSYEMPMAHYVRRGIFQIPDDEHGIFLHEMELGYAYSNNLNLLGYTLSHRPVFCQWIPNMNRVEVAIDVGISDSTRFVVVAVHELGHALGLGHDPDEISSVMYPYATESYGSVQPEDILYIQEQMASGLIPLFLLDGLL